MQMSITPPPKLLDPSSSGDEAERAAIAQAGDLIDKDFSLMRFPAQLEAQFLHDGAAKRLRAIGISGWLALVVFNGFLPVDYLMAPDVFWTAVKVRLGLFTPPAIMFLCVPWLFREWALKRFSPLVFERVVLISSVSAAACLAYILSISRSPTSQYYHVGLAVVVIYGNLVQRMRFWSAVIASLSIFGIHVVSVLMVPTFNPHLVLPIAFLLAATIGFSLMTNYALERDERRRYLLSLRRKHLLNDLGDLRERLQTLSRMDSLTGLYNRRHFQESLQQVWQRAQHDGDEVSVLMLDVDHFKAYNDRYGHPAGDACLARVAQALTDCLRQPGDVVARFGGEEFIAVLPQADEALAQKAAERIRQAVEALQIPHEGSSTASVVTVSLGIASVRAQPGLDSSEVISMADAALYRAKQGGRNRHAQ
jgi:diguanylate cyclase (GGDEF)-like protein